VKSSISTRANKSTRIPAIQDDQLLGRAYSNAWTHQSSEMMDPVVIIVLLLVVWVHQVLGALACYQIASCYQAAGL